ncbi:MAG: type II toxin-antitoxin system RelE/ParE family toxin [Roseovarius sp.]|nr:type II toxin-antitoxin system RelE/ParE family toxin [Roseovarius sp.]MCY4291518.1 type II toxin-antitoxin system RelE/ParE family toxin [Roseovarius sp.]
MIADYSLDLCGPEQPQNYLEQIAHRFQWFADHPAVGRHRDDVADGYRSFPEGRHVIHYLIRAEDIAIIGVPHAVMDITTETYLKVPKFREARGSFLRALWVT